MKRELLSGVADPYSVLDAALRSDLVAFVHKSFQTLVPGAGFQPSWPIEAICHQLDRVRRGEVKRLIINLPPRAGKSTIINAYVAYLLGHEPSKRIIVASYGADLADKHGRDCRTILESNWYRRAFEGMRLRADKNAATDFETTRGGGRLSTSVGGPLTGRGGSLIIIDDPQKAEDAYSETKRESTHNWFQTTLLSRLDNKRDDAIIVVMQRQHVDDLTGHLLRASGWELLSLPAVATEDVMIDIGNDRTYRRRAGEVLYPDRETQPTLDLLRRDMGSHIFEAQYQQNPLPAEGNLIKADWLKTYDDLLEEDGRVIQSWDLAVKEGENNDFSVCVTAKIIGNNIYVIDVFRRKLDYPAQRDAVVDQATRHNANVILIEAAGTGSPLIADLKSLGGHGIPTPIAIKPKDSKETRVAVQSHRFEAGDVLLPRRAPWLDQFKIELTAFPQGRHDDQVDAVTQLLQWHQQRGVEEIGYFPKMGGVLFDGNGNRIM